MLRISSSNVLVVPPFECAWLSGNELQLQQGAGCICFEVKGANDVTVILKSEPGAKRWQPLQRQLNAAGNHLLEVEQNYTVILGSHRNRRLKIEKNGVTCMTVEDVPGAKLDPREFSRYWIDYNRGTITIGSGAPGERISCRWVDPDAAGIPAVQFMGLSCWDSHVSYRDVRVLPPVDFAAAAATAALRDGCSSGDGGQLPTLFHLASRVLAQHMSLATVADTAQVAELLLPNSYDLYAASVGYLAKRFTQCAASSGQPTCPPAAPTANKPAPLIAPAAAPAATSPTAAAAAAATATSAPLAQLSPTLLADVLVHPSLCVNELQVFHAVVAWSQYGDATGAAALRRPPADLDLVLPLIRFPLMTEEQLQQVAAHPFARAHPAVQVLVQEALTAFAGDESPLAQHVRSTVFSVENRRLVRSAVAAGGARAANCVRHQRRPMPACTELMYVCDGDHNGVVRYIGTQYGTQQWVNPVLAKLLEVRASSPASRYTDPRALVSGHFVATSYAGPRYEGGRPMTWWMVDLGEKHRLICNYYTLRHDASPDFARHWVLQGTVDLCHWVDLKRHINDTAIKLPGQFGSWAVTGAAASMPYRAFRVVLAGPTLSVTSPWNLCLCYMELYGYFFRTDATGGAVADVDAG